MDKHFELLVDSMEQAHLAIMELQQAHAMDPRCLALHRHLWIVRHAVDAARGALLDVGSEMAKLRDAGVKL